MKNINVFALFIVIIIIINGCVPQADYDKLLEENKKLRIELDECLNGAERLIAQIDISLSENDYTETQEGLKLLFEKHPEYKIQDYYMKLAAKVEREIEQAKKLKEAEEKEKIRLENLSNTGMWEIRNYVDSFGDPTSSKYITNKYHIEGKFNNTATTGSPLNVDFFINDSTKISIELYEYARNTAVRGSNIGDLYKVKFRDKNNKEYFTFARNYSDRLNFDDDALIHKVLLRGGTVKFVITINKYPATVYKFTIENADWYENAYELLTKK